MKANQSKLVGGLLFCVSLFLFLSLASCYSVRIVSTQGVHMPPDTLNAGETWYRDKMFGTYDTIVKTSLLEDGLMIKIPKKHCESGRIYSIEYKNTFGGSLLYIFSFGSRKKVKIKYVCMLPNS